MKDYLEKLEIGEGKVKLSAEEIKGILAENGKIVANETQKLEDKYKSQIDTFNSTINDLNDQIKNAPDSKEIDNLKQKIADYEEKESQRIADEKKAKEESIRQSRVDAFFNDVKFASDSAKTGVIAKFNEKDFKYDEEAQKFQGASEWLEELKKNDVGAFQSNVANPTYTTNITSPTSDATADELREAMGLSVEKK